jgi:uncharacterized protein YecE (DUF72 family)
MSMSASPRIGTAGWAIRREHAAAFPGSGTHLRRYAQRFNAVEINSSFYRPHRRATYERWAASVPDCFAFAVKVPRTITHELRLAGAEAALDRFLAEASGLGTRLGVLLFQFPPNFAFDARVASDFLAALRARHAGDVVWEPRHATWFSRGADALLAQHRIARVAADPAVVPAAAEPGGWTGLQYFRLHGSPRIYYSAYTPERIARIADDLSSAACRAWCIFDNTALGAATENALALADMALADRHDANCGNPKPAPHGGV